MPAHALESGVKALGEHALEQHLTRRVRDFVLLAVENRTKMGDRS